ncbi:MAG: biotin synthase BioB [Kiritimatiellae bacterium]|nr:biotin synthase BioB [Kiritimatiellia bacterium]
MDWINLADRVLSGQPVAREEALAMLRSSDEDLPLLLAGAFRLRAHHFGRKVQLHVIENARSGACPEDCAYCSQSAHADADISEYPLLSGDQLLADARRAKAAGAVRYCMVMSGRGPREQEVDRLCAAVRRIKAEMDIQVCSSLGLLTREQAQRLAEAGVNRYNHNLESSERFYPSICTTHTWAQRRETLRIAREAGMEICCGGLLGMGETDEDRVNLAFELRDVGADSIPVNLLDPRPGTALRNLKRMSPREGLRILSMFRFVHPATELRVAGGREAVLRSMQPMSLYAANSMFTEGYLTTPGQGAPRDLEMIEDAGFEVGSWGVA